MGTIALPESDRTASADRGRSAELLGFGLTVVQVALAIGVIWLYQLESRTFFHIGLLMGAGFVVHAALPLRARLPFFAMLSAAAVIRAFGVRDGILLLGVGTALVAICHVPVRWSARIALLILAGVGLTLVRGDVAAGIIPASVLLSPGAWAILGSMFMFRLALYVYSLRSAGPNDPKPTAARTFAYFFMAPNVSFPLFPVIDYDTFTRNYYDRPANEIYQTGAKWIARGLVQLILYRLVYTQWANDPTQLRHLGDLIQYLLSTYLLYLRISGSFHLVVGMLGLFGFRLPETHHLYYLASSFNDYWRRINIYWKDFMMKLVYYPSFFRLRRLGTTRALVGATIAVFVSTWLLHSYQWLWLRGGFPIHWPDALFWGILGSLVVWNALRESRRGRKRTITSQKAAWSWGLAWRTLGTFTTICILWSLWSAESVTGWLTMWTAAGTTSFEQVMILVALVAGGLAIGGYPWGARSAAVADRRLPAKELGLPTIATLLGLLVVGMPTVYARLGTGVSRVVASLERSTLNARDQALQHKGYYEKLDNVGRMDSQLWDLTSRIPADWVTEVHTDAFHRRNDFLFGDLRPMQRVTVLRRELTTNKWGMRDRNYELAKRPGSVRVAFLGASHVLGSGVGDDETFEAVLERRIAEERRGTYTYESLNFGVGSYSLLDQISRADELVYRFQPDVVVVTIDQMVNDWVVKHLLRLATNGTEIPYPELRAIVQRAGLDSIGTGGFGVPFAPLRRVVSSMGVQTRMPWRELQMRAQSIQDDVVAWAIRHTARTARAHGAVPVLLGLDVVTGKPSTDLHAMRVARQEGMLVFNLFDVYDDHDPVSIRAAEWDDHPNTLGHRIIADRLYDEFRGQEAALCLTDGRCTDGPLSLSR
jgi:D-alanyl-lipoteichoic acid acyltransferase DltB (MBOAT superfamily)